MRRNYGAATASLLERRLATLALTAALLVGGASAALAQPGPPSDIPGPPDQAQGSPATGQERSAEARAHAAERSGFEVPARDEARADGRAFGQQRAADARQRGEDEAGDDTDDGAIPVEDGQPTDDAGEAPEVPEVPELPVDVEQARTILAEITATLTSALHTLAGLFGLVAGV